MSAAVQLTVNFTTEVCCNCGMSFAMPTDFYRAARSDTGTWFYCPRGHIQHYTGLSEEAKLRHQLELEKKRTEWAQEDARKANRRASALKGIVTRTKKRLSNGVCPCCNRSFQNVARHMQSKHPDYSEAT